MEFIQLSLKVWYEFKKLLFKCDGPLNNQLQNRSKKKTIQKRSDVTQTRCVFVCADNEQLEKLFFKLRLFEKKKRLRDRILYFYVCAILVDHYLDVPDRRTDHSTVIFFFFFSN